MGNSGFEQLIWQSLTDLHLAVLVDPKPANTLYHDWAFMGVVVVALISFSTAICKFFTVQHPGVRADDLALREISSTMYVKTVLREALRVFEIADDHLPLALSQAHSSNPGQSRFDYFCESLRNIPPKELDNRGKYANVIKESFGRIISENARRLLSAMNSDDISTPNPILNPTQIRFALEGEGYFSFWLASRFDARNRRLLWWFNQTWRVVGFGLITSIVAACALLIAVMPVDAWAGMLFNIALPICIGGVFLAAVAFTVSYLLKNLLSRRATKYANPEEFAKYINKEKRRYG